MKQLVPSQTQSLRQRSIQAQTAENATPTLRLLGNAAFYVKAFKVLFNKAGPLKILLPRIFVK